MISRILLPSTIFISLLSAQTSGPVTTIRITDDVLQSGVKRFGINLGDHSYYDAGQLTKNLLFRNPGFEGMTWQSIVQCAFISSNSCTDNNQHAKWPAGFWSDGTFEVISGPSAGRSGKVLRSLAANPNVTSNGVQVFFDATVPLTKEDNLILRKTFATTADAGWWPSTANGGAITTELTDLPPGTAGRQCVRLSASLGQQSASLASYIDTVENHSFIKLSGNFRLSFKAKGNGGKNLAHITIVRLTGGSQTYLDRSVALGNAWNDYDLDFSVHEDGSAVGPVRVTFDVSGSTVLLDDVSLVQTNSSPANRTAFRDPVVAALRQLRPGLLRFMGSGTMLGDSLDNLLAPPFARRRSGYSAWDDTHEDISYGLHEFLELCEAVNAEPWVVVPIVFSPQEMTNLIEYLGGSPDTPFGRQRLARGRSRPWTQSFTTIHLEFGNEAWNSVFKGASLETPTVYGARGSRIFRAARQAPSFASGTYDLVLGGQYGWPGRNEEILKSASNYDSLAIGPYLMDTVDRFGGIEDLFGPLFAEPQMSEQVGYVRQNHNIARQGHGKSLAVYEVNLHTTNGSISQQALDLLTPSVGAGVAVTSHMLLMLRDLGVRDQMLFQLAQNSFKRADGKGVKLWGAVVDMGRTNRRRPQFLALQLANAGLMGDMVRTIHEGSDPTWNQASVNNVELTGAKYLQSFACRDGQSRSIILLNLSRTDSLSAAFAGHSPVGPVTMRQLRSRAVTDSNEEDELVTIAAESLVKLSNATPLVLPPFSMTVLVWQEAAGKSPFDVWGCGRPSHKKTLGLRYVDADELLASGGE
jgi:hypothetical protein